MSTQVPIQKIILVTIAMTGVVAVTALAPGIGPVFKMFGLKQKRYSDKYVNNALARMKVNGLITYEEKNGMRYARLTKKGKEKLATVRSRSYNFKRPKKWDGKWRIVIFDIKEDRKEIRDRLRSELQGIGFVRLQNSVWIFPYECAEFIKMLKADYRIGKDVLYITAEQVEYDKDIKNLFGLGVRGVGRSTNA